MAMIEFETKGKNTVRKTRRNVSEGFNLYEQSDCLEQYKNGYTVSRIDGYNNFIEFANGLKIYAGMVYGDMNEDQVRRIQIREAIKSHIEKERKLYEKGIKVLTLFFIDEVAKYKQYEKDGNSINGQYGNIFEEEYQKEINIQKELTEDRYWEYLENIKPSGTHAGYFSIEYLIQKLRGNLQRIWNQAVILQSI